MFRHRSRKTASTGRNSAREKERAPDLWKVRSGALSCAGRGDETCLCGCGEEFREWNESPYLAGGYE